MSYLLISFPVIKWYTRPFSHQNRIGKTSDKSAFYCCEEWTERQWRTYSDGAKGAATAPATVAIAPATVASAARPCRQRRATVSRGDASPRCACGDGANKFGRLSPAWSLELDFLLEQGPGAKAHTLI